MIYSFVMKDDSPALVLNSLSGITPYGCSDWAIYEPNYHNHLWAQGKLIGSQYYENDCTTPYPNFHTSMKGYTFYLEVWVWCDSDNRCI
jgi:hypothetical protein